MAVEDVYNFFGMNSSQLMLAMQNQIKHHGGQSTKQLNISDNQATKSKL